MDRLHDAPWIIDAEQNGLPENPKVKCPICGNDRCDQIYVNRDGDAVGCEYCLKNLTVWDWAEREGII